MSEPLARIGDTVWVADAGTTEKRRPCRVCDGKRRVTLTMGSGEQVELECGMCSAGYGSPTGVEVFWDYDAKPSPFHITAIEAVASADGQRAKYRSGTESCYTSIEAERCYPTCEAALPACAELIASREREVEERLSQKEKSSNKSYAWNAGYHLREAKRHRKDAEYHEKKAVLLKAKAAPTPPGAPDGR